ncbi:MAG: polymorphic toxin type 15 domain-containing protein [Treponemataceae bacterium]|nr:polymorphic toxin type 15 domain-containing protein [Treponemataceae bacterium]
MIGVESNRVEKLSENKGNSFNPDKTSDSKFDFNKKEEGSHVNQISDSKFDFKKKDDVEQKRMEPPIVIKFKCPERCNPTEFQRQLKGQERGLNSQTLSENMKNRDAYNKRKSETGNGRDPEGQKAQDIARQKAFHSRIESNQKKGMSYSDAKKEAIDWISKQAALHNPDQVAGGDPNKVSRMGDARVNSSIGAQWPSRVKQLKEGIDQYTKGKTSEELSKTKLNVKLEMEK